MLKNDDQEYIKTNFLDSACFEKTEIELFRPLVKFDLCKVSDIDKNLKIELKLNENDQSFIFGHKDQVINPTISAEGILTPEKVVYGL